MAIAVKPARAHSRRRRETRSFYLFVAPWLIGFVALGLLPLLFGLGISFTNYNGFNLGHLVFVGLQNYGRAFASASTANSFLRTLVFVAINVPFNVVLGVLLAVVLNLDLPGRGAFRTVFYLPTVIPVVATVWIWKIFLDQNYGLFNALLDLVFPGVAVAWLVDYPTYSLIVLTVWASIGSGMVIFLAGLQGVPAELKEAARIDGAGRLQIFRAVTLPLLTPVIFFQIIMGIIGSLQVLVTPLLLAGATLSAEPPPQNYFYLVNVYQQVFANQQFGYGIALLWMLFVVILLFTFLVFRSARYWVYYEEPTQRGEANA